MSRHKANPVLEEVETEGDLQEFTKDNPSPLVQHLRRSWRERTARGEKMLTTNEINRAVRRIRQGDKAA